MNILLGDLEIDIPTKTGIEFERIKFIIKERCIGRKWIPEKKHWYIPNNKENYNILKSFLPKDISDTLSKKYDNVLIKLEQIKFLRNYQKDCVIDIINGKKLVSTSTGSGKTVISLAYFKIFNITKGLLIVPNPLKKQWQQEALTHFNIETIIIEGPLTKRKKLIEQAIKENKTMIISYELSRVTKEIQDITFEIMVLDECITGDTLISTPLGKKKIIELKKDDEVYGYNHKTNKIEITKINHFFNNGEKEIYIINNLLKITKDHPIWSEDRQQYIPVKELKINENIKFINDSIILKKYNGKLMSNVQQKIRLFKSKDCKKKILQSFLFCKMENATTRNKSKNLYKRNSKKSKCWTNKVFQYINRKKNSARIFFKDEERQSNAFIRNTRKSKKNLKKNWMETTFKGWKRKIKSLSNNIIKKNKMCFRIHNQNKKESIMENKLDECRFSNSKNKISNRNKWTKPSIISSSRKRYKEKESIEAIRMEINSNKQQRCFKSIKVKEILKEKMPKEVFNIETGLNNYFANGILVHNCQKIKNHKTKTYKSLKSIKADQKILLTATPMINKPTDVFNIVNFIHPNYFDYYAFHERYVVYDDIWTSNGYVRSPIAFKNLLDLHEELKPIMIYKRKEDILSELPEKSFQQYWVEPSKEQLALIKYYYSIADEVLTSAKGNEYKQVLACLTMMRRVSDSPELLTMSKSDLAIQPKDLKAPKIEIIKDDILPLLEGKTIIFTEYSDMADILFRELQSYNPLIVKGGMDAQKVLDIFKESKDNNILISTDVLNFGVNLQFASNIIHYDLPWSPAKIIQREGRIDRMGQTNKTLFISLITKDTVEEKVYNLLKDKKEMFNSTIEGGETITQDVIKKIFKKQLKNETN